MVSIIHKPLEYIKVEEENINTTIDKIEVMYVKKRFPFVTRVKKKRKQVHQMRKNT